MPERSRSALVARRAFAWSAGWVFAAALYLLLIDITDIPELIVGAGAAVLAATGLELAREQGIVGQSIRAGWLVRMYRPLFNVPRDVAIVSAMALVALVRPRRARGRFRAIPFKEEGDEQRRGGRRALVEAAGSLAPNTFVIGIDDQRGMLLAHQLRPTENSRDLDPLELG